MKKNPSAFALTLLGLLATLSFGCNKNESTSTAPAPKAGEATSAATITSADKTSFTEVTSQLDPGGNFFLYLGTAQWLEKLSTKTESWRQKLESMPNLSDENRTNLDKGFTVLTSLIKDSGMESISGLGISSIAVAPGLYRNKGLLHHYPGQGDGFLWKITGGAPHALGGLDFLPAKTAFAIFMDADLPLVWSVTKDEVAKADFPQAQEFLDKLPAQFEQQTQLKWDDVLHSLGGEYGFVLTLDASNSVPIPLPQGLITIPEPGLLFVIKINDDTIFNRVDAELKKNDQVIKSDKDGVKLRTMPIPIPLAVDVRPTIATGGGYLFIGSSDVIVQEALAVKSGAKPGLKSTDEFKQLSQNIPLTGNQFAYVSTLFGQTMMEVQKQVMSAQAANGNSAQAEWLRTLFTQRPAHVFSVEQNTDSGCLTVGNGSQSAANLVLLPAVAVPAMLAAVAVPNFVKARSTSQMNACINNLRIIDAAKQQWALEKGKKSDDTPTEADLLPYIGRAGKFPHCPQGGTYTIGSVGESPTCSIPGHALTQ